ncbi:LPS-assembly protein LptD, partial [bacterium]|nr:LPS-assembly protein LptD [bacterium]
GDKIVVKPLVVYIGNIPIFYLPFGVFPIKKGRHSGIIFPTFGTSQTEGRFIRGLGYYWAPNDYMDAKGIVDYFEKAGFMFRGDVRYKKGDALSGNISGSITRKDLITGYKNRQWDLQVDHRHQINPEMNFAVSGSFVSSSGGNFYRKYSSDRTMRATRELISNATLNKNWTQSKNSISINASRRQDLELGNISETLPQINFSHSSPIYLFKGDDDRETSKDTWYNTINFRYNSLMLNRSSKYRSKEDDPFTSTTRNGIKHSLSFLAPQKVFKHITLNPFFNYREEWFLKTNKLTFDENNNSIEAEDKGFASRRIFSSGLTANTKFFGMFQPNIGSIKAIRHVLTPSMSFNYQPDFSSGRFGYYSSAPDSAGIYQQYDRFGTSIFGSTPNGRSQSVSLSLQNLFQMKMLKGDEEAKHDLFNLNFSTSYNFARETFKLADLRSSFRTLSFFDIDISSAHSFYRFDEQKGTTVDTYIKGLPRLLFFQASSRFTLTGNKEKSAVDSELAPEEKYEDTTSENKQNR